MTIDEAIAHAREVAKRNREQWKNCPAERDTREHLTCEECAEEHEQLAEWLEELKKLREAKPKEIPIATININEKDLRELVGEKLKEIELDIQAIRAKAIDEFAEKICEKYTEEERNRNYRWYSAQIKQNIADIAEQMKVGGENEND